MIPKVSIVVPVYKVEEKYLRVCIESCINQTLKDIEIILVDDGSPDNCGEICDNYAKTDNRIIVVHKKNQGLSAARNTGYKKASGETMMFLDGDDWIDKNMCFRLYNSYIENDVDLVMCGISRDYSHSSNIYMYYIKENYIYSEDEIAWLQEQLLHFNSNIGPAYAKLFRKEFLDKYNLEHNSSLKQGAEGLEFNIRVFEHLERAMFINSPYYHYTYNPNSISSNSTERNNQFVLECYKTIQSTISNSKNKDLLEKWFDNRMLYIIITTAISGYFNPAFPLNYKDRKDKFKSYLKEPIVNHALNTDNLSGLSKQRRIVLWLIKHNCFLAINCLGIIRKYQKSMR